MKSPDELARECAEDASEQIDATGNHVEVITNAMQPLIDALTAARAEVEKAAFAYGCQEVSLRNQIADEIKSRNSTKLVSLDDVYAHGVCDGLGRAEQIARGEGNDG